MKTPTSITLAAVAVLLASVSAASAAGIQSSNTMSPPAKDTLMLSNAQQKTAWHDLYTKALNQAAPSGFGAAVGAVVPKKRDHGANARQGRERCSGAQAVQFRNAAKEARDRKPFRP